MIASIYRTNFNRNLSENGNTDVNNLIIIDLFFIILTLIKQRKHDRLMRLKNYVIRTCDLEDT